MSFATDYIKTAVPFDEKKIFENLDHLRIDKKNNLVSTFYYDKLVHEQEVSTRYYAFDFPDFTKSIVSKIDNYFKPVRYRMDINRGIQELRIFGDEVDVNGEKYFKMLSLLNSSNRMKSLQINIGLLRLVCANGMVAAVPGENASIKSKHFHNSLSKKIESFSDKLKRFGIIIDKQLEIISNLNGKMVSFHDIVKGLIYDESKKEMQTSKISLARKLAQNLISSETDKLDTISSSMNTYLFRPELILYNKKDDFQVSALNAYNCYTESFRGQDTAKIALETNRILNIITI